MHKYYKTGYDTYVGDYNLYNFNDKIKNTHFEKTLLRILYGFGNVGVISFHMYKNTVSIKQVKSFMTELRTEEILHNIVVNKAKFYRMTNSFTYLVEIFKNLYFEYKNLSLKDENDNYYVLINHTSNFMQSDWNIYMYPVDGTHSINLIESDHEFDKYNDACNVFYNIVKSHKTFLLGDGLGEDGKFGTPFTDKYDLVRFVRFLISKFNSGLNMITRIYYCPDTEKFLVGVITKLSEDLLNTKESDNTTELNDFDKYCQKNFDMWLQNDKENKKVYEPIFDSKREKNLTNYTYYIYSVSRTGASKLFLPNGIVDLDSGFVDNRSQYLDDMFQKWKLQFDTNNDNIKPLNYFVTTATRDILLNNNVV